MINSVSPSSHRTCRRSSCSGQSNPRLFSSEVTAMKSVSTIFPDPVANAVSRTLVLSVYRRETDESLDGQMLQCPPIFESTSAPKMEALSKRGQQSQSIEPRLEIKAADLPSPMTA